MSWPRLPSLLCLPFAHFPCFLACTGDGASICPFHALFVFRLRLRLLLFTSFLPGSHAFLSPPQGLSQVAPFGIRTSLFGEGGLPLGQVVKMVSLRWLVWHV